MAQQKFFKVRRVELRSAKDARLEMRRMGVDPGGISIMAPKQFHFNLKLSRLTPPQANILKQDILSIGGEAAVAKGVVSCEVEETDCILSGTLSQLRRLVRKLKTQPYRLTNVAEEIEAVLENISPDSKQRKVFKTRTRTFDLASRTLVMGILNVTPDSFSDGSQYFKSTDAVSRALAMCDEGADIIDVGGESTRPGAEAISEDEELRRVMPVVECLVKKTPGIVLSIDTTKAEVARRAIEAGAEIINDVSALERDAGMAGVAARSRAGLILMHLRGTPATMQQMTEYEDITGEVFSYLSDRADYAVQSGVQSESIVIDPGFGFAKDVRGNLELLRRLKEFTSLGFPVLCAVSRKSFIEKVSSGGGLDALEGVMADRLPGTISAICAAVLNGASIVRVHDVKEVLKAVRMMDAVKKGAVPAGEAAETERVVRTEASEDTGSGCSGDSVKQETVTGEEHV